MVQYGARSIFTDPLVCVLRLPEINKNKNKNKKTKRGKCQGRSLHVGAPSLGNKVSYMNCSVPASSWEASFAGFLSYSGVARLFVCNTVCKQQPPSLHRLHYCAV